MRFPVLEIVEVVLKKMKTFWVTSHKDNINIIISFLLFLLLKEMKGRYRERKIIRTNRIIVKKGKK